MLSTGMHSEVQAPSNWNGLASLGIHVMRCNLLLLLFVYHYFSLKGMILYELGRYGKKKKKGEREALPFPLLSENCDSVLILQILSIIYTHSYSM